MDKGKKLRKKYKYLRKRKYGEWKEDWKRIYMTRTKEDKRKGKKKKTQGRKEGNKRNGGTNMREENKRETK